MPDTPQYNWTKMVSSHSNSEDAAKSTVGSHMISRSECRHEVMSGHCLHMVQYVLHHALFRTVWHRRGPLEVLRHIHPVEAVSEARCTGRSAQRMVIRHLVMQ